MSAPEPVTPTDERLRVELALQRVLAHYVHCLDAKDYDALDQVFTANARFDFTTIGAGVGYWPEIKRFFVESHGPHYPLDFHAFANVAVTVEGPDSAISRSKVINPRTIVGDTGEAVLELAFGVYTDCWTRTAQGWRIRERRWDRAFAWNARTGVAA